jgi:hypothetical protein
MKVLKIFPCGTVVFVKMGQVEGMITAIIIRFDRAMYEVRYFLGGEELSVILHEDEFQPVDDTQKKTIGYK